MAAVHKCFVTDLLQDHGVICFVNLGHIAFVVYSGSVLLWESAAVEPRPVNARDQSSGLPVLSTTA